MAERKNAGTVRMFRPPDRRPERASTLNLMPPVAFGSTPGSNKAGLRRVLLRLARCASREIARVAIGRRHHPAQLSPIQPQHAARFAGIDVHVAASAVKML